MISPNQEMGYSINTNVKVNIMSTYKQTLKTTKSSTPKSLDLSFIGPMLPKVESKKVEPKKVVVEKKELVEKKKVVEKKAVVEKKEVVENKEVVEKKRIINRPIFCYVNDKPYNSLCDALRQHNISLDKKTSPWFKINRELKKHGEYQHESLKFSLPK